MARLNQAVNTMTHKGHVARVEYDERDDVFVGRILGLRAMISFHGETVDQLRREFAAAVADCLADCKASGLRPERPASGKILLRVPPEVHGAALVAAQASGKSLNQWATEVLQDAARSRKPAADGSALRAPRPSRPKPASRSQAGSKR